MGENSEIISKSYLSLYETRYVVLLPDGYSGHKLLDYFRRKNVQCEMSFSSGVVLIFSPFNNEADYEKVYNILRELRIDELKSPNETLTYNNLIPEKAMEPYEVFEMEYEYCNIVKASSKIAKESIIPYPPGVPIICPGETITEDAISIIKDYIENNRTVIGIENGLVKVVKE